MRNRIYYRQFVKKKCERCGFKSDSLSELHVHHKNHKHWDDRRENLETLCESCHVAHHKQKKRKKIPLSWLADFYSIPGGKQGEVASKKGILDHFM